MEQRTAETLKSLARDDDPLDPPAGRDALGRSAPVGRGRACGDVELEARHPRRADRGARRRPDRAGARAGQEARRAGPRRHPDLAQPARRLRRRRQDLGAAPRTERRLSSTAGTTTQEEVVHAITAGQPTKVSGITVGIGAEGVTTAHSTVARAARRRRSRLSARAVWENIKGGNLGSAPVILGLTIVVIVFSFTAQNFFTAVNLNNIITQMAGTTMLAFGVVFILLIGEIDLSIAFLSGIAGVVAAELQESGHRSRPPRDSPDRRRADRRPRSSACSRGRSSRSSACRRSSSRSRACWPGRA